MQKDIIGKALLDYFQGNYTEDIITQTNISDKDTLPLPYLFRNYHEMPAIEQKALQLAKGKILDVGCCAGNHSLFLQQKGMDVTAIDLSPGAIEVCVQRGLKQAYVSDFLAITEQFDTVLLLMNGSGIFQNLEKAPLFLRHLKQCLKPNGQILIDSSDLIYMFDKDDIDGGVWIPKERTYYGEITFQMSYKGEQSNTFDWLFLDFKQLKNLAQQVGLQCEFVLEGSHFDYLAKLY